MKYLKKCKPSSIGLIQAIGVVIYCALIALVLFGLNGFMIMATPFISGALMLLLLVISAAVTGLLVFGYPAILALDKKINEAIIVVTFTLLYSALIFIVLVTIVALI